MTVTTSSFDIGALSDTGRKRKNNEDACMRADTWLGEEQRSLRDTYGRLYIVADGVGGNEDGEVASRMVVNGVMEYFYTPPDEAAAPQEPIDRLRQAIARTSREIAENAIERKNNMASTIVAALIQDSKLIIANVGDSPAILVRPGKSPQKLTTDHLSKGRDGQPILSQAMGDVEVKVTFRTIDFEPDDVVVLCSDGLTDLVKPEEIAHMINRRSAHDATRALIDLANKRGGHDNITALVVRHGKVPLTQQKKVRQAIAPILATLLVVVLLVLLVPGMFAQGDVPVTNPGVSNTPSFERDNSGTGTNLDPTATLQPTATPTLTPEPTKTSVPMPTAVPQNSGSDNSNSIPGTGTQNNNSGNGNGGSSSGGNGGSSSGGNSGSSSGGNGGSSGGGNGGSSSGGDSNGGGGDTGGGGGTGGSDTTSNNCTAENDEGCQ